LNNPKLAGLRAWPVNGFPEMRIYYLVSENVLRIVRVLHSRRDIGPMLEADEQDV
jgi:toxin ParE1/3/4